MLVGGMPVTHVLPTTAAHDGRRCKHNGTPLWLRLRLSTPKWCVPRAWLRQLRCRGSWWGKLTCALLTSFAPTTTPPSPGLGAQAALNRELATARELAATRAVPPDRADAYLAFSYTWDTACKLQRAAKGAWGA